MDADDDNAEPALEDLDLPDRPDETAPTVRRGDDTAGGSSTAGTSGTRAPDPGPVAPLTVADLRPRPAEGRTPDGRPGWALLVVLGILAAVLVAVVVHADLGRVADPGWQDNALWAAGAAVVLLGAALAAVAWTVSTPRSGSTLARSAVLAAVFGVVAAVVVVGLADDRGGEIARSSVAASVPSASTATTVPQEPVLGVEDALDPQYLAPSSLPIDVRTT